MGGMVKLLKYIFLLKIFLKSKVNVKDMAKVSTTVHGYFSYLKQVIFTAEDQQVWSRVCLFGEDAYTRIEIFYSNCAGCTSEVKGLIMRSCS